MAKRRYRRAKKGTQSIGVAESDQPRKRKAPDDEELVDQGESLQARPTKKARTISVAHVDEARVMMAKLTSLKIDTKFEAMDTTVEATDTKVQAKQRVDLEFVEPTHRITGGPMKGYEVIILNQSSNENGDDDDDDDVDKVVLVQLIKNGRGREMKYLSTKEIRFENLHELDSYDIIEFSQDADDEGEEPRLLKHQKGTWKCPKCGAAVTNDNGLCPKKIDGSRCGSAPRALEGETLGGGN